MHLGKDCVQILPMYKVWWNLAKIKVKGSEFLSSEEYPPIPYINWFPILFLIILFLSADVGGVESRQLLEDCQEKINTALMEYCTSFYPNMKDKFGQVLLRLPEIRMISMYGEEYLYSKHLNGELPEQTLLTEMLHSKRRWWQQETTCLKQRQQFTTTGHSHHCLGLLTLVTFTVKVQIWRNRRKRKKKKYTIKFLT